jgi:type III restriction enzyme
VLFTACSRVMGKVADSISKIEETFEGSKQFNALHIHEVFKDKKMNYANPHDGGVGISQNDPAVVAGMRLDLSGEDWYVFNDNYGTSEEKSFVAYFKGWVQQLRGKYDKVFLVRNERQLALYSFSDGERFEPDYVLFLHKKENDGYEQMQIFIEPKGAHLIAEDKWKEDFLLELEANAVPVVRFKDDNEYRIWGFHFYNHEQRSAEFEADMRRL